MLVIKHYPFTNIVGCHITFLFIFDPINLNFLDLVQSEVGPPFIPQPTGELRAIVMVHGH